MKLRIVLVLSAALVVGACGSGSGASGPSSAPVTTTTGSGTVGSGTAGSGTVGSSTVGSGTAGPDAVVWAGTFCAGVSPTVDGVKAVVTAMVRQSGDPAAQKAALLDHATRSRPSLTDAGEKLSRLGPPTPAAAQAHDELVRFFSDFENRMGALATEAVALDPADPRFAEKLARASGTDLGVLTEQVKKLQDDPVLVDAFKRAPECGTLTEKLKNLAS